MSLPTSGDVQAGPKREVLVYGEALLCSLGGEALPVTALLQSKAVSAWFRKQPGLLAHSPEQQAGALVAALATDAAAGTGLKVVASLLCLCAAHETLVLPPNCMLHMALGADA